MPNTDLSSILEDVSAYKARYKSLPIIDKPASCNMPVFDNRSVDLTIGTVPTIDKECLKEFIPIPIQAIPYIPIEDVQTPCPAGFKFESTSAGLGTISSSGLTVTGDASTRFTSQIPAGVMPDLVVNLPYVVTGISVTAGGSGYITAPSVTLSAPNITGLQATAISVIDSGVVIAIRITEHGYGYTSAPTVTFGSGAAAATATTGNADVKRRVASVTNDSQVILEKVFPINLPLSTSYQISRIVVTADVSQDTGGDLNFTGFGVGDPNAGCGGYFIGRLNIALADLNIALPCNGSYNVVNGGASIVVHKPSGGGTQTIAAAVTGTQCSPVIGLSGSDIVLPSVAFADPTAPVYFDFSSSTWDGSTYTIKPDLKYTAPGKPDIRNTPLFQAIKDALGGDPLFEPCNGCSLWS